MFYTITTTSPRVVEVQGVGKLEADLRHELGFQLPLFAVSLHKYNVLLRRDHIESPLKTCT